MSDKEIIEFAQTRGYKSAKKENVTYKGCDVYTPIFKGDGIATVGFPLVILVKGQQIRMSTESESLDVLAMLNPQKNDSEYF